VTSWQGAFSFSVSHFARDSAPGSHSDPAEVALKWERLTIFVSLWSPCLVLLLSDPMGSQLCLPQSCSLREGCSDLHLLFGYVTAASPPGLRIP